MIKKILLLLMLMSTLTIGQELKFGEAKGLFMSIGVGPRIPVGDFSESHNIGSGFDVTLSYTDNYFLPVFFYSTIGFQHYPGKQDYYKETDHTSISSNMIYGHFGVRHYFPPLVENIILLMPVLEAGFSASYIETYHQFKTGSGKSNSTEGLSKTGAHIGAGFSMFLLDVLGSYNYYHNSQYLAFDLRIRIPIFVTY